jgi:hypothetical protein
MFDKILTAKTDKIGYFFDICCNSMTKWLVGALDEW